MAKIMFRPSPTPPQASGSYNCLDWADFRGRLQANPHTHTQLDSTSPTASPGLAATDLEKMIEIAKAYDTGCK